MAFGVAAFGHALPPRMAAEEFSGSRGRRHTRGYRHIHRAGPGVGVTDLAMDAARSALKKAGTDPSDIDLLVLAIPDIAEYLYWDAAAAVQAGIGAERAEALLLGQACTAGVMAFDCVAGRFATHPGYRTALIIAANRVCDAYVDRLTVNTSIGSDGAAAIVAERDAAALRWMLTEVISDGRWADFLRMDVGGTALPFASAGRAEPRVPALVDRMDAFFEGNAKAALEFAELIAARTGEVIQRACSRAGIPVSALARVIYLHDNADCFSDLARQLGIGIGTTNLDTAMKHGHLGCADQLLSLESLQAAGELATDDIVALVGVGSGMHWVCTLLRV
jgi:3-oxoacyl-[acyl-carrier-protein] synthase-3